MAADTGGPRAPSQACWSPASLARGEPAQSSLTHGMSLVSVPEAMLVGRRCVTGPGPRLEVVGPVLCLPALGSATGLLGQSLLSGRPPSPAGLTSGSVSGPQAPSFFSCSALLPLLQLPGTCVLLPSALLLCACVRPGPAPVAWSSCPFLVWGARNGVCWAPGACEWGLGGWSAWAWAVAGWAVSPCCFCSTVACCALQPQSSPPASPHCTSPTVSALPGAPSPAAYGCWQACPDCVLIRVTCRWLVCPS